jgi:hypothetical protein
MALEPTIAVKICTVCGTDCAKRPRIKDQQGRYICKECFDKAKQTKQALKNPPAPKPGPVVPTAPVPAESDNSFLLTLGSRESTGIEGTKPCPECGRALPTSAVMCIGCGYNLSTGKRIPVRVIKAKPKELKAKGSSGGGMNPALLGVIILAIYCGLAVGISCSKDFALMGAALAGLLTCGIAIWGAVVAFQDGAGTGLLYLFLPFYSLYWIRAKCEDSTLKWAWLCMLIGSTIVRVVNAANSTGFGP